MITAVGVTSIDDVDSDADVMMFLTQSVYIAFVVLSLG